MEVPYFLDLTGTPAWKLGRNRPFLVCSPLKTVRAPFSAYGSSLYEAPPWGSRFVHC